MTNSTIKARTKKNWKHKLKNFIDSQLFEKSFVNSCSTDLSIELFDADNIDKFIWSETEEGEFAKRFLVPLVKNGTRYYIDNIDVEFRVLKVGEHALPLVLSDNDYKNSYVCSPYGHYIELALESLLNLKNSSLRYAAKKILVNLGKILKRGKINQIIYVNHWLFSTDLYPNELTPDQVSAAASFLKLKFPNHAIAFRSINAKTSPKLKKDLTQCGFKFIASRQVYITETSNPDLFNTRIIKSDLKLWNEREYEIIENHQLSEDDGKQILNLYKKLTLEHHSHFNPCLNLRFIQLMIDRRLLQIRALKKDGMINGVVGYVVRNHIFTCPFFGYDKSHKDHPRLYRLLSTLLLLEAKTKNEIFHQSAGASFYKTVRRASTCMEYLAVYTKHLPYKQRGTWWFLRKSMNVFGIPFMKKF